MNKNNIQPINADGVHELMVIGSALKDAKDLIAENKLDNTYLQLDDAIKIVDKIINDGFDSIK